jgi:aryl-alcohol dehydrogenase-like predicted oxidoreductase
VDCRRGGVGGPALSPANKPFLDQVLIATKFDSNIVNGKMPRTNSRPEHILEVCDASLERLGVGVIDLFTLPIERDLIVRIKIAGFAE